tara:strand:- start:137 stop:340 length:204 start_codon:yes stop_codon:yes gene_type:complete
MSIEKEINWDALTDKQKEFVLEYKVVHKKLTSLRDKMDILQGETTEAIEKLEDLRKKEKKLFNNGKK